MTGNRPKIYNTTLTLANTEYTTALDRSFFSAFTIQCRQVNDMKMAFKLGDSGTTYFTIPAGASYSFDVGNGGVLNIYLQSPVAGSIAEILVWE